MRPQIRLSYWLGSRKVSIYYLNLFTNKSSVKKIIEGKSLKLRYFNLIKILYLYTPAIIILGATAILIKEQISDTW